VIFILIFVIALAAFVGWWLSKQGLASKPWLEASAAGELVGTGASRLPTAKFGMAVFLVVIGALFTLFFSAYSMRMSLADWRALPAPNLLWLNTGVLVFSSVALQYARGAARRGRRDDVRTGLFAAGIAALAFLAGQLLAWQQLAEAGYYLATNPANAFFYLLTAVHGLHLLGGVVALGRVTVKVERGAGLGRMGMSVELCAIYWHFLLVVWVLLFAILLLGADASFADFLIRCNSLFLDIK
jgi:cytochrome c oxidase subunit 3